MQFARFVRGVLAGIVVVMVVRNRLGRRLGTRVRVGADGARSLIAARGRLREAIDGLLIQGTCGLIERDTRAETTAVGHRLEERVHHFLALEAVALGLGPLGSVIPAKAGIQWGPRLRGGDRGWWTVVRSEIRQSRDQAVDAQRRLGAVFAARALACDGAADREQP